MNKKYLNIVLIVVGIILGFYSTNQTPKDEILLIVAIIFIMIGVYRISKTIPSKTDNDEERG